MPRIFINKSRYFDADVRRFERRIDYNGPVKAPYTDTPCHIYPGAKVRGGYREFWIDKARFCAHRFAYEVYIGPIPAGLDVLHLCNNPPCVNPDHMVLGTQQDNEDHKVACGRQAKGEDHSMARLTAEIVLYCRMVYRRGHRKHGINALARKFGVTAATVMYVIHGITWRHLLPYQAAYEADSTNPRWQLSFEQWGPP